MESISQKSDISSYTTRTSKLTTNFPTMSHLQSNDNENSSHLQVQIENMECDKNSDFLIMNDNTY